MTDTPTPEQETAPTDDDALRKRLLGRIAVAAVVIVALLGSLAIFDAMNAPPPPPPAVAAVTPPPVPSTPAAADDKPAEGDAAKADAAADTTPKAEVGAVASAPEGTSSPAVAMLPPLPPEKPLTKPATSRQASIKPSEQLLPALPQRPDVRREVAASARPASPMRPLGQSALAGARQLALQLGVFSNLANAEDLRAKLELAGIPASIEARVQVGPFNTRAEVDAAREKLKSLGMDPGIVVSLKRQ